MKEKDWIVLGLAAGIPLAVIAAFLGVIATLLILSLSADLLRQVDAGPAYDLSAGPIITVLLLSLAAAVTPFVAVRFFLRLRERGEVAAQDRQPAWQVGWMMALVAIPWWLVCGVTLAENLRLAEQVRHLVFQTVLTGGPAILATASALAAFRLSAMSR